MGSSQAQILMSDKETAVFKVMLVPEFEDALIGIARHNGNMVAVYDMNGCIEIMVNDGMKAEAAVRWLTDKIDNEFNEDHCPAFVVTYSSMVRKHTNRMQLHGNN